MALGDEFERLLKLRETLRDDAIDEFEARVEQFAENAARRLCVALGVEPVFAADGDDGVRVGRTDFEQRLASLSGIERLKAGIFAAQLSEIEDFVDASGMDQARSALRKGVYDLAGAAESTFELQGVQGAAGALDSLAAEALIGNYIESNIDDVLRKSIDGPAAVRIRDALSSNIGLMSIEDIAFNIAENELLSINQARTEARTRMAEADSFVQETTRRSIDPDEELFALAYIGPTAAGSTGLKGKKGTPVVRPFCRHLVGKAFTVKDFKTANNFQTPTHPRISRGGYNCRHTITPVIDDDEVFKAMKLVRGTVADVKNANQAAQNARKRKGRKRRRRK